MNKSIYITILTLFFNTNSSFSQLSKVEYETIVSSFIDCIRNANIDKLDSIVSYPIHRPYPIPSINNKQDLKNRYSEIFDKHLTAVITNSDIKKDWKDMGWRGIMLNHGIVWIDYDGRFIKTNYSSEKEQKIEKKWIAYERNLLYKDLKEFQKPVHTIETKKFIIRIDLLKNGNYRYASWSKTSNISNKPDLVLYNGKWTPEGSGGNHHFTFTNKAYQYLIHVNILREDATPPFHLEVRKNNQTLLTQSGRLKKLK